MAMITDQQIIVRKKQKEAEAKYVFKFRVKTRKVKGGYRASYILHIKDARSGECLLIMSLKSYYPIVDYLSSDDRYIRDRDYVIVKDRRRTKAGELDLIEVLFHNTDCARRVTVFVLSILGVENKPSWISKMMHVVRKLSPEAIDFWLNTAYDRFVVAKSGLSRRFCLLRVAKAMRTLYERNADGGIS